MGWMIRGFESRQGLGIFLSSRPALGLTQPPIQWAPGALSLGVKRQGREDDHSPPSSAKVKNAWKYTSTIRLHGVVLSYSTGATLSKLDSRGFRTKLRGPTRVFHGLP
jgi:hypothetical protein